MIVLDNSIVSDDLNAVCFACDLQHCKGACCIEGDAGAPLEEEEIALLEDQIDAIKPFMTLNGIREIEQNGVFDYDSDGEFVTPLIRGRECAYICFDEGIARCAIEEAFIAGKIAFHKPISCHLYPIRITKTSTGDLINYHQWPICDGALKKGKKEQIPLVSFVKEALIRKYGKPWFESLLKQLHPRDRKV